MSKKLINHTIIYTVSAMFSSGISFIMLPIVTRLLSPEQYGIFEVVNTYRNLLTAIILFGGSTYLQRHFYNDDYDNGRLIGNILAVNTIVTIVIFLLYIMLYFFGFNIYLKIDLSIIYGSLILLLAFIEVIVSLYLTMLQIEQKPKHYAFCVNFRSIIEWILTILVLLYFLQNWQGRFYSIFLTALSLSIIGFLYFHNNVQRMTFDYNGCREFIKFGYPLIIAGLSGWIMEMMDKIILVNISGLSDTGIYSLGYKVGMIMMIAEVSITRAWAPYFYKNFQKGKNNLFNAKAKIILLFTLVAIFLCITLPIIADLIFSNEFKGISTIIPLIVVGYYFDGLWKLSIYELIANDKTKEYTVIIFISAFTNLLLNFILIPKLGNYGAAIATMVAFFIGYLLSHICVMIHRRSYQ